MTKSLYWRWYRMSRVSYEDYRNGYKSEMSALGLAPGESIRLSVSLAAYMERIKDPLTYENMRDTAAKELLISSNRLMAKNYTSLAVEKDEREIPLSEALMTTRYALGV